MLRLLNLALRSAVVLTGVSIGAVLGKSRSRAGGGDAGPLKESVADLEARLSALESAGFRNPAEHENFERPINAETLVAVASLEATVASVTTRFDGRLARLETRVGDHETKLKELPTLAQVVTTMEEMLSNSMSGLDQKLADQVRSIDVLKTTVAQSDELMKRVLDSLDSLQTEGSGEGCAGVPSPLLPHLPHHPPMAVKLPLRE